MHKKFMLPVLLLGLVAMAPAQAEDAQDIVAKMLELQDERRDGVNR